MLGQLRMSVSDCIDAYLRLSERVLQNEPRWFSLSGKLQARFGAKELQQALGDVIIEQKLSVNELLEDESDNACKA
jgi:hypothetical protein